MIEAETIDAMSTIQLLESLQLLYPLMVCIHVFLDNARYHHATLVKEWLSRPGCRIKLHFLPAYCPHLNPSSGYGASCTRTSRTTKLTALAKNSPKRPWISCATRSLETGPNIAVQSQIIFV